LGCRKSYTDSEIRRVGVHDRLAYVNEAWRSVEGIKIQDACALRVGEAIFAISIWTGAISGNSSKLRAINGVFPKMSHI
jgi:hypothetical protein